MVNTCLLVSCAHGLGSGVGIMSRHVTSALKATIFSQLRNLSCLFLFSQQPLRLACLYAALASWLACLCAALASRLTCLRVALALFLITNQRCRHEVVCRRGFALHFPGDSQYCKHFCVVVKALPIFKVFLVKCLFRSFSGFEMRSFLTFSWLCGKSSLRDHVFLPDAVVSEKGLVCQAVSFM